MTTRTDRIQVIFEVGGDGKLKATLGDLGREGDKAAQGLDRASAAKERMQVAAVRAAAVLGGAMVTGLGLVIKNTMEAEQVSAQLDARLKSTAGAAGLTRQAIDELADATARKTTYDDDAIKSLSAMLLTFTKVHADVFPRATAAITDMATAMGTDLQSATIQVGKALNDPIEGVSALTRVGVQFTDEQQNMIKALVETGQTAEAQAVILRELETQFGGAAEAARDTFGGALVALKNTLMDLTEGGAGSLDGATEAVNDFNDALNDPQTREGIAALVGGLFDLMGIVAKVPAGFALMGKFIGTTLAEIQNQAAQTAVIMRNIGTLGMADGTIAGALKQQSAGRANYQRALDDMVLGNHGMTRSGYTQQFQSQFNLGLPGSATTQVLGAGSGGGFNFAADQASRSASSRTTSRASTGAAPRGSATGGGSRASAPRAMPDFGDEDLRDLQRLIEETARADEQFARLAATLGGPLAEAEYEHQQNLHEIEELGAKAGRSAADISALKEEETARYEDQRREIEATLDPMGQLLASYQQEIGLMGMGNAERAMANELRRQGIDLASAEAQAYMDAARATDQQARVVSDSLANIEDAKGQIHDFLMDFSKDAKGTLDNIDDYFAKFIDSVLSRWLNSGIDGLFSGKGFSGFGGGGGGGDGFWNGLLNGVMGLFGGGGSSAAGSSGGGQFGWAGAGYSGGGYTGAGGKYEPAGIVHRGEYVMDAGTVDRYGPQFFDRLRRGQMPMVSGGSGDVYITAPISIRGDVTPRSADQMAGQVARRLQRQGRNR